MSMEAPSAVAYSLSPFEQLRFARQVIRQEGEALLVLADRLHDEFCDALHLLHECQGNVIVTGMGKAGLVGQKIAATFASTGTSSHFVHPAEAVHGDLGRIHRLDVVLALSFSGRTEELTRLLPSLSSSAIPLIAVTGDATSPLGRAAHVTLELGPMREACSLGLAPSTSTTAMLALGDALALVLSRMRGFGRHDFARFHPGGSLGRKLAKVEEVMRPLAECRVAGQAQTVRQVLVQVSRPGRRTGAIMLVDEGGRLAGLFTDSDLARMLEHSQESALDAGIDRVMTRQPLTVVSGTLLSRAVELLAEKRFSELPVVDEAGKPIGLIDITDVVAQDGRGDRCDSVDAGTSPSGSNAWRLTTLPFPAP